MSKNRLDETLNRLGEKQIPSVKDAVDLLIGRDKRSISKSEPKYTKGRKDKRIARMKEMRDGVGSENTETIEKIQQIPKIDHISEIPDGFPDGTVLNDDGTLTLPDGRTIRKKMEQEVDHGQAD
jgi:hypothetical protein